MHNDLLHVSANHVAICKDLKYKFRYMTRHKIIRPFYNYVLHSLIKVGPVAQSVSRLT